MVSDNTDRLLILHVVVLLIAGRPTPINPPTLILLLPVYAEVTPVLTTLILLILIIHPDMEHTLLIMAAIKPPKFKLELSTFDVRVKELEL